MSAATLDLGPVGAGESVSEPFLEAETTGAQDSSQRGTLASSQRGAHASASGGGVVVPASRAGGLAAVPQAAAPAAVGSSCCCCCIFPTVRGQADQGRLEPRDHNCIFPFRLFPIRWIKGVPTWLTKVKDWLHLVLLLGVGATISLFGVVFKRLNEHEDWDKLAVHLSCCLVVLPSTLEFIAVIRSWDDRGKELQHKELREAIILEGQKKLEEDQTRERLKGLSTFAETMQDRFLETQLDHFDTFVIQVRKFSVRELEGVEFEGTGVLAEFTKLVVHFAEIFGQARLGFFSLAAVQGATEARAVTDIVKLIDGAEKCQSIEDAVFAWEVTTRSISTGSTFYEVLVAWDNFKLVHEIVVKFLHHTETEELSSTVVVERSFHSEVCSRLCGGQKRCGFPSWLKWREQHGERPKCFECEQHEVRETSFGENYLEVKAPYSLHAWKVSLRVLSAKHQFLMLCLLTGVVAIIATVMILGRHFALALVMVNEVCIVCTLLCFEQIDKDEQEVAKLAGTRAAVERAKERNDALERLAGLQGALRDLLSLRLFPILDLIGKVAKVSMTNDQALNRGAIIFGLANGCIQSANRNLCPVKAWLELGRVDEVWKENQGKALTLAVKMQDVMKKNPIKEAADQVKALEDSLVALKQVSESSAFRPRFVVPLQEVCPAITATATGAGTMTAMATGAILAEAIELPVAMEEGQLGAAEAASAIEQQPPQ